MKKLQVVLFALVGAVSFAAFGLPVTGQTAKPSGSIDFWVLQESTPEAMSALEALKNTFESKNPGTKVNLIPVPQTDYAAKLGAAIAADATPDGGFFDPPLVASYVKDKLLDTMPADLLDPKTISAGAYKQFTVAGKQYGLPIGQTCVLLYRNTELVPTAPKNWSQLLTTAQKVYDPQKKIAAMLLPDGGYGAWIFPAFVATAGGKMLDADRKIVSFTQPPAVRALTLWRDLIKVSPREIINSPNAFGLGRVAMMVSGPWELTGLRTNFPNLKWDVSLIPKGVTNGSNIGGFGATVFSKGKNKPLAWAFVKYLTDPETNVKLNREVRYDFPINLNSSRAWIKGDKALGTFLDQMKYANARPTVAAWPKISDEIIAKVLEEVEAGKDPAAALNDAAAKARVLLGW